MTTYVDPSALVKLYVEEADSADAVALLKADPVVVSSWVSVVEVRRNLARLLTGADLRRAREACERDFDSMALVLAQERTFRAAAEIAEHLGVRSLDALHLASAQLLRLDSLTFCTFDLRQGQAARRLGMRVVGC